MLTDKAHSLLAADKPREALACDDEVLKLDLNHAEALVKKGSSLERWKQDLEAIQCYESVLQAEEEKKQGTTTTQV